MAKTRSEIEMSPVEVGLYMRSQRDLLVATIGRDGMPHLSTMWYGLSEGRIVFASYRRSQKIVNLKRDPRLSVSLSSGDSYTRLKGVVIYGEAELADDPEVVANHQWSIMRRNWRPGDAPLAEQRHEVIARARKRTSVVVNALKVVSWDHTKLGE